MPFSLRIVIAQALGVHLLSSFDVGGVDLEDRQPFAEIQGQPGFPLRIRYLALQASAGDLGKALLERRAAFEKVSNLSRRGRRTELRSEHVKDKLRSANLLLEHLQCQDAAIRKIVLL